MRTTNKLKINLCHRIYRVQRGGRSYQAPPRHSNDESKYPKRSGNDSYNSFGTVNTYGTAHQGKPPRFQRNQETHANHQQDNVFKSNYPKTSQPNDRKSNASFGQSRGEMGVFNAGDIESYTNKSHREDHRGAGKNNYQDRHQAQQVDTESKNRHGGSYDVPHGRHNRSQADGGHRAHGSTTNMTDKNYRNQSNRPQQSVDTEERGRNNYGNSRNTENETAGGTWVWKVGEDCMAKYWEDNRVRNFSLFRKIF